MPLTRSIALPLLAAAALSCTDSTGPDPADLVDIVLDFCSTNTPVFLAVGNEDADWVRVTPDGQGSFAFEATPTFGLAIVHQAGTEYSTEYVFTTPEDVEPLNGASCIERTGAKTLDGTVAGVPVGSAAMVSMAGAFDYVTAADAAYTLNQLASGPLDLIAHREVVGLSSVTPDRVIVRRAQDRVSGSFIPVLDFAAAEALPAATHSFTATGVSSADDNYYLLTFSTPTTRRHSLSTQVAFTAGSQSLHGVPGALTQSGDLHELEVFADGGSSYRGEVLYYRIPVNRSVTLGADLATPTLSTVSTSPALRLRTRLPSQSEYGTLISVVHEQDTRTVVLTATRSFYGGTPGEWDLTIPDLGGVPGFPSAARLQSGDETGWYVEAYGGTDAAAAFFGGPGDGSTLHFAGRAFSTSARQFTRGRGAERLSPLTRRRGLGAN